MTTVLAIDQGTSGTKAVVVDGSGTIVALYEVPLHPRYGAHGSVEQDPQELLNSVLEAGRAAVAAAGLAIDAVTLANQGESVLAWHPETGTPLTPVIVWQDNRAHGICEELAAHAPFVLERTGLALDPYFSAPKQAWIRRMLTREGVVTTSDTWLIHQLTGEFVTDVSTASRSLVFDLASKTWDRELLELFGLAGERLPQILANDEVVGTTDVFGPSIPLAGVVVDQQAALLSQACLAPGDAKCTFGTGAFLVVNTGEAVRQSATGLASSVAWRVRGETAHSLDGQVYTVASAVRWLQQLGLIASAEHLDSVAAADAGGALSVPAFAGLAAPRQRPDATAAFAGMTLATGPGHLVRATLEGIAAQVAELTRCVATDLGTPLDRLRVDGGLTRSQTLMQAVADITQLPLEVSASPHSTPLGAATLARLAVDPSLTLADAVIVTEPSRVVEPQWGALRAEEFLARWGRAADSVIERSER